MNDTRVRKFARLREILRGYESVVVAFSGGVDSSFLLAAAGLSLPPDKVLAVTAVSETYPPEELSSARKIARQLRARHMVITTHELDDRDFRGNPANRCYFCKRELFAALKKIARGERLAVVVDAGTLSDRADFRPGSIAGKELGVRSPLSEAGMSKDELRFLSKSLNLPTWNKPSLACLASRIPYGTEITAGLLRRINQAELIIRAAGFSQVRLRHYGDSCRIEVPAGDILRLVSQRRGLVDKLKKLGYNYITADMQGYRTGSMNEALSQKHKIQIAQCTNKTKSTD